MKPEKTLNVQDIQKKRFSDDNRNRDAIMHFIEAGGDDNTEGIVLNEKQIELLSRWRIADEKIRERKYKREQIAQFLIAYSAEQGKKIGRDTAYRDIVNAEYIFCSSFPLNKKYLYHQRIELLILKINECYINNDFFNAAMLEKTLQKYIDSYPEQLPMRGMTTINMIVNTTNNNLIITNLTPEQAFVNADDVIKQMEEKDDY